MQGVSINHIKITVSDFERSKKFYDKIFKELGLRKMFSARENSAWHGKIVGYGNDDYTFEIQEGTIKTKFNRKRIGLDHIAFTARSREMIDEFHEFLMKSKVKCSPPREYSEYEKGYYAVFFEDPDGIILELVYTP
ncbi:MAG: VOC family protein [Candidatus Portnoybacteria bacterium]|nr:VOC family protein [Candidatus Portnoybacteria bacterium]